MSTILFSYSVLEYVHSDLLGESLNIGILFHFTESRKLIFRQPTNFSRLRCAYGRSFSSSSVGAVLKGISTQVAKINKDKPLGLDSLFRTEGYDFILDRLLLTDATVLRFKEWRTAVQYADAITVADNYYELYFKHYNEDQDDIVRRDEEFIAKDIKRLLYQRNSNYANFIKRDVQIAAPKLPDGHFAFDFSWQNEVLHYVKPIGFDLQEQKNINQKAAAYFGYLSAISDEVGSSKIDILITRPQKRILWEAYDKAIALIDSVGISKKFVEQGDFEEYADDIIDHLERDDTSGHTS